MEKLIQQNPFASPLSPLSNPSGIGVRNLLSTPLSPSPIHSTQPPAPPRNCTSPRSSETSEVVVYPSSVSLRVCIHKNIFLASLTYF
jgi:hypothetical protein